MNINPGKFKKKIVLQEYIDTQDKIGNCIQYWQNLRTMFADINSLYGKEYWAAASQGQQDTIVFTVRWCPLLDRLVKAKDLTLYRISIGGNYYKIKDYDNIKFANQIVKIKAVSE